MMVKVTILDDIDLRVRQKPCKNLLIKVDGHRLVLTENRHSLWAVLFVLGLAVAALAYFVVVQPPENEDAALVTKVFFGLVGLPYVFVTLFVCPWNRRVTLDRETEVCGLQYRFYFVPFWFRSFCAAAGEVQITSVIHVTYSNRVPETSIGDKTLSMMLGTAGTLMGAFETLNSRVEHNNRCFALVYAKPRSRSLPILATCRDGRAAVQALGDFCTQIADSEPWPSSSRH